MLVIWFRDMARHRYCPPVRECFILSVMSSSKVLELICTRESGAVFEAGGLNCVLTFIRDSGHLVHKDTLHSAMSVVSRLCSKMEPQDSSLETCVESLSSLLKHEDHQVTFSDV